MRQASETSSGVWRGDPLSGVKAPQTLILPDPAIRFSRTAVRLEALSAGHPMAAWLRFMGRLAQAQHEAAAALGPRPALPPDEQARAVDAGLPPLNADGHRPDPVWRDGLRVLLDACGRDSVPAPALAVIARLRGRNEAEMEALAHGFLQGSVGFGDAGAVLYVAAALQVYFTRLAADLPASSPRLLPRRGLCPSCGSTPVAGVVTASGRAPGARYLHCSLCATAWNHVRAMCVTCGQSRSLALEGIEDDNGAVKAETCNECQTYAKMLYQARDVNVDPFADDLATLGLDVLVAGAGWARHAPNPLLLTGR